MGSNLPPITRGANSKIPDYIANADTLFQELEKVSQRVLHVGTVLAQYGEIAEMKTPVVPFDTRDLSSLALLLPEGPDLDNQIRQMRDDFYSADPVRKKPWLDILYDEFDQGLLVHYDPSKPEEAHKIVVNATLSQTYAVQLDQNPAYLFQRYPTASERELCNQRLILKQVFEPLVVDAVRKNYDANGKKFAPDDTRIDFWEAYERNDAFLQARDGYAPKTAMTIPTNAIDDQFIYPAAERGLAEYEAQKTGIMAPMRITVPAEFSSLAGKSFEELNVAQHTTGHALTCLGNFTREVFAGNSWLESYFNDGDRMLIDGMPAKDFAAEKFPNATKDELTAVIPAVITAAIVNGEHKLSMLHILKADNGLYQAHPVPLVPDLIGIYPDPETRKQVEQRQAEANQRPFTTKEALHHQKMLNEVGTQLLELSTDQMLTELTSQLKGDTAPELIQLRESLLAKEAAIRTPLRTALAAELNQIKVPHYSQTGLAPAVGITLPTGLIPISLDTKEPDTITLDECRAVSRACTLTKPLTELLGITVPSTPGLNIYDTMLIDGKSVSQMVNEHFQGQAEPYEMPALCQVTLATAIASGNHQISTFRLVEEKGLCQVQEQPIEVDVSALYPSRQEAYGWFRTTFFDWGPFKAPPTRGELAQQRQDALLTRSLTEVQQADKDIALQAFHTSITDQTFNAQIAKCGYKEARPLIQENAAQVSQLREKIELVAEARLTKWKNSLKEPDAPEKNNPQKEEKTQKIEKTSQAEKSADKQMPM